MNTIGRFSALSLLCVLVAACATSSVTDVPVADPETPVKRYLAFYFDDYGRGLPGKSNLPLLATFVTPELLGQFEAAIRGEECYAKKSNYEGPPYIEGDLFSSLFEGGTSATYRQISGNVDKSIFEIEWINDDKNLSPDATIWHDRVFLVRTTSGWLIADFAHDGDWDFMKDGSVSEILQAVAKECAD